MSKLDSSISPLDSRYAAKIKPIAKFFSESYLNKTRYEIELMWLIYISKKVFNKYVEDPSNENEIFTRVRIRNLIKNLENEGLDKNKFKLSIQKLKSVDQSIQFFCEKNLRENSIIYENKVVLNEEFFNFPQEVLFRSFSQILQLVGKKYFPPRGKKIVNILENLENKITFKTTLGNCVIKKINRTVIVYKER